MSSICLDAFQILEYVMYPLGIVVSKYWICTWYWGGGLHMYTCTSTYVISVTCTFPCNTNKIGSLRKVMFLTFMMCYEINICKKCVHKCLTQTQIEQKINRNTHHGIVGVNFNCHARLFCEAFTSTHTNTHTRLVDPHSWF